MLAQMISKGTVQSEELKGQLGERLPSAFNLAAKAMGVNTQQLGKMLENGEVLATDLLPRLALELNKTFVPTEEMLNGPQAAINRMKQAFIDLADVAGKAGFLEGITNFANSLNDLARGEATLAVVRGLGSAFKYLSENSELIAASLGAAAAAFSTYKAQAAIGAMVTNGVTDKVNLLKTGLNSLMAVAAAAAAGFAFGDWANQFETVRLAGSYMLEYFIQAFEATKLNAELAFIGIKLAIVSAITPIALFFVKAAQGWVGIFTKVAEQIDGLFGSNLAAKLAPAGEYLQKVFDSVDEKGLGAIKAELAAATDAMTSFTNKTKENHKIFEEQRDAISKAGAEADKLGMSIGELEKATAKKAKADQLAAKWAADLAEQTRILNEATVKNTGLNNIKRIEDALNLVGEAKGRADETAGSILKLSKDISKLNTIVSTSPKILGQMEASMGALGKEVANYKKEMSKAKADNNLDEYKQLAEKLAAAEGRISDLKTSMENFPSTIDRVKEGINFLNVELAEVSRSDADKYFDEATEKLSEQEEALKATADALMEYKDEVIALGVAKAVANGADDRQIKMLVDHMQVVKEMTEYVGRLKKTYKSTSDIFSEGFGDMFENMGKTLAPSLQDAISSGDWAGVGKSIGNMLSSTLSATVSESLVSSLGGGALAGVLGPIGGAIAGGIVDLAVNKIGDYLSGGFVDPTADRQAANGTGTVLGSIDAKSQSIANATDLIAASNDQLVSINRKMLGALENLTRSISSASTQVMKDRSELSFTAPSVDEHLVGKSMLKVRGVSALLGGSVVAILDGAFLGLSAMLGKLLKGKSRKVDEGIRILGGNITDLVDNAIVQAFVESKVRRWKGDDWDRFTSNQNLGDDTNRQFSQVFSDIVGSVTAGASALGMASEDIKAALAGFTVDTTLISTEGLDAAGQDKALQEYFSKIFDKLAIAVLPMLTDLQKGAEGPAETLARVSTEYSLATEAYRTLGFSIASNMGELIPAIGNLKLFGDTIGELAVPANVLIYAASELVNLVGGVDAFSEALASFEQNFLTESENFINLSRRLGDAMGDLPLPETREGFRELLQAQNATTEAGRENIALLLKLQGVADGYYSKLEDWSSKISSSFKNATTVDISSDQLNAYLARLKEGSIDIEALTTEIGLLSGAALDAGEAIAGLTATQQEARDLEIRKLELLGDASGALSLKREKELETTLEANRAALLNIYAIEDSIAAEKELANSRKIAADNYAAGVAAYSQTGFQAFNVDGVALTSEQIQTASDLLVASAGDINTFNSSVSSFANSFVSAESKLATSASNLISGLGSIGKSVPATREGFTALLQSMNAMTESGRNGISTMLKLSNDANAYYTQLEAASGRMYDLELRLLKEQGKDLQVLWKVRSKELDAATNTEKAILRQIYAAEDLNAMKERQADIDAEAISKVTDVRNQLNSAYQTEISNLTSLADKMKSLGSGLRDFGTSLKVGDLSTLSPQEQLAVARSDFTATANAARGGDVGAIERLQAVATTFLEESRSFQGSGGTYSADFEAVQAAVSQSASVAEIQAQQAERQRQILENQLEVQQRTQQEQANMRQAVESLVAVQRESGTLSLQQLNEIRRSLAILESNSALSSSR